MKNHCETVRIPMKDNRFLVCPSDWVILNSDESERSTHACALYLYNGPDFGGPEVAVFFSDTHADEFNEADKRRAYRLLEMIWPGFLQYRTMELQASDNDEIIATATLSWMYSECVKAGYPEFALALIEVAQKEGAKEFMRYQRETTGMQNDKIIALASRFTDPTLPVHGFFELYPESYHITYNDPAPCGAMIIDAGKEESANA